MLYNLREYICKNKRRERKVVKMKRRIFAIIVTYTILLVVSGCTVAANNKPEICDIFIEPTCTLYRIGDNSVTVEVAQSEVTNYINSSYMWSIEPTRLMYATDGNTSWIWESEVEVYKKAGWSLYEPVTIFSATEERRVLREEVSDYLATGIWFETKSAARPITISTNPYQNKHTTREP